MSKLQDLIESFNQAFYDDDFAVQMDLHSRIEDHLNKFPESLDGCALSCEYKKFCSDWDQYQQCIELLESDDWNRVRDKKNIKIESRGGGSDFFTRSSVLVEKNLFDTLAVLSEIDLVPTCRVDVMKGVTVVSAPTKTRKLVIYHMSFPWPLSDRELVVTFNALPNPEDRSCTIVMATPQSSTYLNSEIPPCDRGKVRINVPIGCLYVKYLSENLTRVVFVVSANANIRYLPGWLINFGSKHIMYSMMATLRNKIENFEGSVYEKRVQEKPEYYSFLREKIDINLHQ